MAGSKTRTQVVLSTFERSATKSAKGLGREFMQKPDIQPAASGVMQQEGLTRMYRGCRLKQHADHEDPTTSLPALSQPWKLDDAYSERHAHLHLTGKDCYEMSQELNEIDAKIEGGAI